MEMGERRRDAGLIADIRVDVATVKERTLAMGVILNEVKAKLESSVSRGEYETRHKELETEVAQALSVAQATRDDTLRRQGGERVWRIVYGFAIAGLGLIVTLIQAKII